ncbi:MAG: hypothetical protein K8U57_34055 [Planctomycetes bacterium]|nr:hypothetical protein [Planctomycetota bacterium]
MATESTVPAEGGAKLRILPPDELRYGGNGCRVGWKVWRAVKIVAEATDPVALGDFYKAVWPEKEKGPLRLTVQQLIGRANAALEGISYPRRLRLEGDTVELADL